MARTLRCRGRLLCVQKKKRKIMYRVNLRRGTPCSHYTFLYRNDMRHHCDVGVKAVLFDDKWRKNARRLLLGSNYTPKNSNSK